MRTFRVGDRVTSIAISGLGAGIIFATNWDSAEVIWSDGKKSTERYSDLIYAPKIGDSSRHSSRNSRRSIGDSSWNWKDTANAWVGKNIWKAEQTLNQGFNHELELEQALKLQKPALGIKPTSIYFTKADALRKELTSRSMANFLLSRTLIN